MLRYSSNFEYVFWHVNIDVYQVKNDTFLILNNNFTRKQNLFSLGMTGLQYLPASTYN